MQSTDMSTIINDTLLVENHIVKSRGSVLKKTLGTALCFWREAVFRVRIAIGLSVLIDFLVIHSGIGFVSHNINRTAGIVCVENSGVGASLLHYVNNAFELCRSILLNVNSKANCVYFRNHESVSR